MNGKDLLDIMAQVDDDLILESEAAPEEKKNVTDENGHSITPVDTTHTRRPRTWIAPAAGIAATVLALTGLLFLIKFTRSKHSDETGMTTIPGPVTTTETGNPTTMPTAVTDVTTTPPDMSSGVPGEIYYCPDDSGMIHDTLEVPAGTVEMPTILEDAVINHDNRDIRFAVTIEIYHLRYGEEGYPTDIHEEIDTEIERFRALGYDLELMTEEITGDDQRSFKVTGTMTGEELFQFMGNPDYGYQFSWLSV